MSLGQGPGAGVGLEASRQEPGWDGERQKVTAQVLAGRGQTDDSGSQGPRQDSALTLKATGVTEDYTQEELPWAGVKHPGAGL